MVRMVRVVRMVRCYVGMPVSLVCCSYIMRGMHGTLVCMVCVVRWYVFLFPRSPKVRVTFQIA